MLVDGSVLTDGWVLVDGSVLTDGWVLVDGSVLTDGTTESLGSVDALTDGAVLSRAEGGTEVEG